MKIVVAGGHGLVGSKLVARLKLRGHEVVAASRRSGVNTLTGEGLQEALDGAHAVVDVTNAPSFEEPEVTEFFTRSSEQLLAAGERAGIAHHLALSVIGTQRLQTSAYFRAKDAQERLVKRSKVPHTLVQATQFFEFMASIIPPGHSKDLVQLSPALVQPAAADDVAAQLADLIEKPPSNSIVEIAGPETYRLNELVQWVMYSYQDDRPVVADATARYYDALLDDHTLTPGSNALLTPTHFRDWLDSYLSGAIEMPHVHHPNPMSPDR
ncbi:SDR family oxidoreductase [Lysobacter sp. S4-A87]|uniref:SDR family oxidoreductase n=1 Tax=Lysobacter sp. S4-A87 TaxID=2925843 RepID=UPI001F53AFD6|nr:SDR family oxidoreductase [Lysobacter sp. S4-A87]UNK48504.1 SDR family oxidoreductase [Lysobacter sp. S4-A87]